MENPNKPATVSLLPNVVFALQYATRGWYVFPLHSIDPETKNCTCKRPDCDRKAKHPRTKNGVDDATTDEQKIRDWFRRWPSANIGLSCGPSGLVVVDVDPRNGGDETLCEIESKHGAMPATPIQLTGGGGQHYLFQRPESGGAKVRGTKIPGGIDIKADGGYIVVAPSNHESGRSYFWDGGHHPNDEPIAPCPDWLLAILRKPSSETTSTINPGDGLLGAAFKAAGWAGRSLGTDKISVQCPWEGEHTSGNRFDGSTVVFSPNVGKTTGHFWCAHSHCQQSRSLKDVLAVLPKAALVSARKHCKLPENHQPPRESEPAPFDPESPWTDSLRVTADGAITRDTGNAALLLTNLPDWKGCIRFNEFSGKVLWARPAPVLDGMEVPAVDSELQDWHATYVGQWLAVHRRVSFSKDALHAAIDSAARAQAYNPLVDYLRHLVWDKKPRVANWLSTYLRAASDEYTQSTGKWWLISAVARAEKPGCQVDHVLVLKGKQGARKSSALIALAGSQWCLESLPRIREGKDAMQILRGNWICILSELESIRGAAFTETKDYVTRRVDKFRPSHGRFTVEVPRACIFAGTTNEEYCLPPDPSGLRRWWPVNVGDADIEGIERDRDQLWAEAYAMYCKGEHWWPDDEKQLNLLNETQSESVDVDPWISAVLTWLENREGIPFESYDILRLGIGIPADRMTRGDQTRIGTILKTLGYKSAQVSQNGYRVRMYSKCEDSKCEDSK